MRELTPEDNEPVGRAPGERPPGSVPTIHDVAAAAGVSKSVVSRALSGAPGVAARTVTKVKAAAEAMGYVANANARGMSAHRTHTLGVFVRDAATPFYGHLLTAFQEQASARGYRAVTATGSGSFSIEEERRALETLVSLRVEGLIVCSGALPVEDIIPFAHRIPTVIAGRPETDPSVSSVYCDEVGGGRGMAERVVQLGHRRVAVMTHTAASSLTQSARTEAMVQHLRDAGVDVLPFRCEDYGLEIEGTDSIVQAILDAGGVTALMAPSDSWALAVLESLQLRGLTAPNDISVTGYDGVKPFTSSLLGFTSWRQPLNLIGRLSVDDVVDQIEGLSQGARHRSIDGELIPGRTAAALSA
ncbi:LacI family DNA-binding transcriptional regulator [Agreia pratensis]|uniref:Transcriptional regulator, LacI family n=1 Tax=Agreia pratensis TaxID=150121 RepID=A0A1X7IW41_9MICO|nr:LacI family DNA-binding transcriptional regulator [Agreia pratensis]MBF4636014.1 LacI family DNA-binding transcriptional regulator [Agreia pratensis]SMG19303.1 transcriptional regulator, LacI family [Agreia pratensis]